jgi:nucleotide-binding universal stress UspA family protein
MKTMLVPVDFSDVTPLVLRVAGDWAVATGHRIHLLHVMADDADLVGFESGLQLLPRIALPESPEDQRHLQACAEDLTCRDLEVTTHIVQGSPVLEILDEAIAVQAELIVMGSHRHGMLHHLLLGSVSGGVLKRATCPVLVVPTLRAEEVTAGEVHTLQAH